MIDVKNPDMLCCSCNCRSTTVLWLFRLKFMASPPFDMSSSEARGRAALPMVDKASFNLLLKRQLL